MMTENIQIYKKIEKWSSRPGVVAIATRLMRPVNSLAINTGIYEDDVHTKEEAIKITLSILNSLRVWEKHYSKIIIEAPSEIREYLWRDSGGISIPEKMLDWKNLSNAINELIVVQEDKICWDYPGATIKNVWLKIKEDISYYERLLLEFSKL